MRRPAPPRGTDEQLPDSPPPHLHRQVPHQPRLVVLNERSSSDGALGTRPTTLPASLRRSPRLRPTVPSSRLQTIRRAWVCLPPMRSTAWAILASATSARSKWERLGSSCSAHKKSTQGRRGDGGAAADPQGSVPRPRSGLYDDRLGPERRIRATTPANSKLSATRSPCNPPPDPASSNTYPAPLHRCFSLPHQFGFWIRAYPMDLWRVDAVGLPGT